MGDFLEKKVADRLANRMRTEHRESFHSPPISNHLMGNQLKGTGSRKFPREHIAPGDVRLFTRSVQTAIRNNLANGQLTIDRCAVQLGVSRRKLQRGLSQQGVTFSSLVMEVRLEMATELLAEDKRSVGEIACKLGYASAASFARAFRRSRGVSPSDFRRGLQAGK